jgi:hypothetical protein
MTLPSAERIRVRRNLFARVVSGAAPTALDGHYGHASANQGTISSAASVPADQRSVITSQTRGMSEVYNSFRT